jgi:hypothetical protein
MHIGPYYSSAPNTTHCIHRSTNASVFCSPLLLYLCRAECSSLLVAQQQAASDGRIARSPGDRQAEEPPRDPAGDRHTRTAPRARGSSSVMRSEGRRELSVRASRRPICWFPHALRCTHEQGKQTKLSMARRQGGRQDEQRAAGVQWEMERERAAHVPATYEEVVVRSEAAVSCRAVSCVFVAGRTTSRAPARWPDRSLPGPIGGKS